MKSKVITSRCRTFSFLFCCTAALVVLQHGLLAARAAQQPSKSTQVVPKAVAPAAIELPPGYVIGPEDLLSVVFWREPDLSGDVLVRPDGKISIPLLNDVQASGFTPQELREKLIVEAQRFLEDPNPTVVVKEINSRKVFITGQIAKPGPYPLTSPTTVLQLISIAGGLNEFADSRDIRVIRTDKGKTIAHRFDYKSVTQGKLLHQNLELKPGDIIIVN